jgi:hypothetical protein
LVFDWTIVYQPEILARGSKQPNSTIILMVLSTKLFGGGGSCSPSTNTIQMAYGHAWLQFEEASHEFQYLQ